MCGSLFSAFLSRWLGALPRGRQGGLEAGYDLAAAVLRPGERGEVLEVIRRDHVRTARAKGLSEGRVVLKHGLRNALIQAVRTATEKSREMGK